VSPDVVHGKLLGHDNILMIIDEAYVQHLVHEGRQHIGLEPDRIFRRVDILVQVDIEVDVGVFPVVLVPTRLKGIGQVG